MEARPRPTITRLTHSRRATYVESIEGQGGKIDDQTVPSQAGATLHNWHIELARRGERLRSLACVFDEEFGNRTEGAALERHDRG